MNHRAVRLDSVPTAFTNVGHERNLLSGNQNRVADAGLRSNPAIQSLYVAAYLSHGLSEIRRGFIEGQSSQWMLMCTQCFQSIDSGIHFAYGRWVLVPSRGAPYRSPVLQPDHSVVSARRWQ